MSQSMLQTDNECFSVVVYPDNSYTVLKGDYTGLTSDGLRPCQCVSVHPTFSEAHAKCAMYRLLDLEEELAESLDLQEEAD